MKKNKYKIFTTSGMDLIINTKTDKIVDSIPISDTLVYKIMNSYPISNNDILIEQNIQDKLKKYNL